MAKLKRDEAEERRRARQAEEADDLLIGDERAAAPAAPPPRPLPPDPMRAFPIPPRITPVAVEPVAAAAAAAGGGGGGVHPSGAGFGRPVQRHHPHHALPAAQLAELAQQVAPIWEQLVGSFAAAAAGGGVTVGALPTAAAAAVEGGLHTTGVPSAAAVPHPSLLRTGGGGGGPRVQAADVRRAVKERLAALVRA